MSLSSVNPLVTYHQGSESDRDLSGPHSAICSAHLPVFSEQPHHSICKPVDTVVLLSFNLHTLPLLFFSFQFFCGTTRATWPRHLGFMGPTVMVLFSCSSVLLIHLQLNAEMDQTLLTPSAGL